MMIRRCARVLRTVLFLTVACFVGAPAQVECRGQGRDLGRLAGCDSSDHMTTMSICVAQVEPQPGEEETCGALIQVFGGGTVNSVAFSPDGTRVLTAGDDSTAKLWDVATRQVLWTFVGHTGSINAVAFSPDGATVLTGSHDRTAKLWNVATGRILRTFAGHSGGVNSVAFSSDAAKVLTGSDDGTAALWGAADGQVINSFRGHWPRVYSVAFSPDGTKVLTADGLIAELWDVTSGQELRYFVGPSSWIRSVAFSPDGTKVLTAGGVTAELRDVASGEVTKTYVDAGGGDITSVAFSPDGTEVLMGSEDYRPRLWNTVSGQVLRTFEGHTGSVSSVAFSPDGSKVLTGSWDETAKLWDATSGQVMGTLVGHSNSVWSAAFSPDATQVLTGSDDGTARLWDVANGQAIRSFKSEGRGGIYAIYSAAFSPDGSKAVTGGGTAELWDVASGRLLRTFVGHSNTVLSVAFSPDGTKVLTGSWDQTAKLWDTADGQVLKTFKGHTGSVGSVAFSPNGALVLTGSGYGGWDKTAKLWDAASGQVLRTFAGHSGGVNSVAFSPDGTKVLTGSYDGTAKLWDVASGQVLKTFEGDSGGVNSVAFSPDGTLVLTGEDYQRITLWDATSGQVVRTYVHSEGTGAVTSVVFSPDGSQVLTAVGYYDSTAKLWQACPGTPPGPAEADVFHLPAGQTSLEFVTVAHPGNPGELSSPQAVGAYHNEELGPDRICGAVDYVYQIGKYEVTNAQYCEFLNAVAKSNPHGLYNTNMANVDKEGCGITRSGAEGSYTYKLISGRANKPVEWVSFWDACRFANWLHHGQGNGDTETGAYTLTPEGIANNTVARNTGWRFAVTSEDEWYKAAYHKNDGPTGHYWDYPTGSDAPPTPEAPPGTDMVNGSANYDGSWGDIAETDVGVYTAKPSSSPYGTFDQGGNAWEWNETTWAWEGYTLRGVRGGEASSNVGDYAPGISVLHAMLRIWVTAAGEHNDVGFRVAKSVVGGVVFEDDFGDGVADRWRRVLGTWNVRTDVGGNQVYQGVAEDHNNDMLTVTGDPSWTSYTLHARMKMVPMDSGFNDFGLVFYAQEQEYLRFTLGAEDAPPTAKITHCVYDPAADEYFGVAALSAVVSEPQIVTGRWYNVSLILDHDSVSAFVDGELVAYADDLPLSRGYIGLSADAPTVLFDDVVVILQTEAGTP